MKHFNFLPTAGVALLLAMLMIGVPASAQTKVVVGTQPRSISDGFMYRIPSIIRLLDGSLRAHFDKRIGGTYGDIGGAAQIDQMASSSIDNGVSWGSVTTVLKSNASATDMWRAFSDPATVCDRETGKLLMINPAGVYGFNSNGTYPNLILMARSVSSDNGVSWTTTDITQSVLQSVNLPKAFFTSGRIMQSATVKVGDYYRLYSVLATSGTPSAVAVYSDDFGQTWHRLGGASADCINNSSLTGANESKLEELPNGDILLCCRPGNNQTVRFFNLFHYTDKASGAGTWQTGVSSGTSSSGSGTYCGAVNSEIMLVPAKDASGNDTYVLLLSVAHEGASGTYSDRRNVGIYYKELKQASDYDSPSDFQSGWTFYQVSSLMSAYSTMCVTADNEIGLFYEDNNQLGPNGGGGYDMTFVKYPLETITSGKFTLDGVAAPKPSASAGVYSEAQHVSLTCATAGATIHYTLDGSTPTISSPVYTAPIAISENTTLKAVAIAPRQVSAVTQSAMMTAHYTISNPDDIAASTKAGGIITLDGRSSHALLAQNASSTNDPFFGFLRHDNAPVEMMFSNSSNVNSLGYFTEINNDARIGASVNNKLTIYNYWANNMQCRYVYAAVVAPKGYRFLEYTLDLDATESTDGVSIRPYTMNSDGTLSLAQDSAVLVKSEGSDVVYSRTLLQPQNILYFRFFISDSGAGHITFDDFRLKYAIDQPYQVLVPTEHGDSIHTDAIDLGTFSNNNNSIWTFNSNNVNDKQTVGIWSGGVRETEHNIYHTGDDYYFVANGDGDYYVEAPRRQRITGVTYRFFRGSGVIKPGSTSSGSTTTLGSVATSVRSNYSPNGAKFTSSHSIDWDTQVVYADIDLTNCTGTNENVLSVGNDITTWICEGYHLYYTKSSGNLQVDYVGAAGNTVRQDISNISGKITVVISKEKGITINGTQYGTPSQAAPLFNLSTINIGSQEGNNRSRATYNEVSIRNLERSSTNYTVTVPSGITNGATYAIGDGNGHYLVCQTDTFATTSDISQATQWTFTRNTAVTNGYWIHDGTMYLGINYAKGLLVGTLYTGDVAQTWVLNSPTSFADAYQFNDGAYVGSTISGGSTLYLYYNSDTGIWGYTASSSDTNAKALTVTASSDPVNDVRAGDYTVDIYDATGTAISGSVQLTEAENTRHVTLSGLNNDAVKFHISGLGENTAALYRVQLTLLPLNPEVQTIDVASKLDDGSISGATTINATNYMFNAGDTTYIMVPRNQTQYQVVFRNADSEEKTLWYTEGRNENNGKSTGGYSNFFLVNAAADNGGESTASLDFSNTNHPTSRVNIDQVGTREQLFTNISTLFSNREETLHFNTFSKGGAAYATVSLADRQDSTVYVYTADEPTNQLIPPIGGERHIDYRFYTVPVEVRQTNEKPVITFTKLYSSTLKGTNHKSTGISGDNETVDKRHTFVGVTVTSAHADPTETGDLAKILYAEDIISAIKDALKEQAYFGFSSDDPYRSVLYVDMSKLNTVSVQNDTINPWDDFQTKTADNCLYFMPVGFARAVENTIARQTTGRYISLGNVCLQDQQPFFTPYDFTTSTRVAQYTREGTNGKSKVKESTVVLPFNIGLDGKGHPMVSSDQSDQNITFSTITTAGVLGKDSVVEQGTVKGDQVYAWVSEPVTDDVILANQPHHVSTLTPGFSISVTNAFFYKTPGTVSADSVFTADPLLCGSDYMFHGTYTGQAEPISETKWYFASNFYWCSGKLKRNKQFYLTPFRAYVVATEPVPTGVQRVPVVHDASLIDQVPTGISDISGSSARGAVAITAGYGTITVEAGEAAPVKVFTLSGQLVASDRLQAGQARVYSVQPGVYVVNGKKVIVK